MRYQFNTRRSLSESGRNSFQNYINFLNTNNLRKDENSREFNSINSKINIKENQVFMSAKHEDGNESCVNRFLDLHFPLLLEDNIFLNWEYICDICSKAHLNQNAIPSGHYVKGMENLIFIRLPKFNKIFENWIYQTYGMSSEEFIRDHNLVQFSKKSHKVSEGYLPKPLPIDFDRLVSPLIKNLKQYVVKQDKKEYSNRRYGGTHPDIDLINIYSNRSIHKWFGIIYKITQKKDLNNNPIDNGLIQIGFSTERFSSRWYWYQRDAFIECREGEIYELMKNIKNAGENLRKVTKLSKTGIGYIGKNKSFTWEILEICWSDAKLRTLEIEWIGKFRSAFGDRVGNVDIGEEGGAE